ncbi:MAG: site-2 protease family protein [Planctomycetes bacterium]|nr:site-2 protease family protein [Planctomycetota bacterium]
MNLHDLSSNHLSSLPPGEEAAPAQDFAVAEGELPPTPFEQSVLDELDKIRNPRNNWTQSLVILAVSVVVFAGLGMGDHPIAFTLMLVGVLFVHELGHYLGMRFFGYQNVRMFFIPLFGAAVSGRNTRAKSYQEAIVTLLGPLPGLVVAIGLFGAAFLFGHDRQLRLLLIQGAVLFAFINAFNLLPVLPLDGGQLLNQLLFSRHPYLEGVFQGLAAVALVAYGATQSSWVLLLLGVWMLMTIGVSFKTNAIARSLRPQAGNAPASLDDPIPLQSVRDIIGQMQRRLPGVKNAKPVATITYRIWQKMHLRPPGAVATVVLLAVYLLAALLTLPWILMYMFKSAQ